MYGEAWAESDAMTRIAKLEQACTTFSRVVRRPAGREPVIPRSP
jgi:hypothetical protein